MRQVIPSRKTIFIYALAWVALYLVLYFFFKDLLPSKYFRDSVTIQKLAEANDAWEWGGAYEVAATLARILPSWMIQAFVSTIGVCTVWIIVTSLRTYRGMILIIPVLTPMIILDLLEFGKEVFVIPLTFILLWASTKIRSRPLMFLVIVAAYLMYGCYFRQYYLIILGVFAYAVLIKESNLIFRPVYVTLLFAALLVVPGRIFADLQGSRDHINFVANFVWSQIRTSIYNPYPPDNWYHFIANYVYTFLRLNLPILFMLTGSDIALFINVLIYGRLSYTGMKKNPPDSTTFLSWLFLAHVIVLWIFEPDSGSYLRHFSSVIMYLIPALKLAEERYAAHLVQREAERNSPAISFSAPSKAAPVKEA